MSMAPPDEAGHCGPCDFSYERLPVAGIPAELMRGSRDHAELLGDIEPAALRRRPRPEVWSALEYACHVRDMLLVQRTRVLLALAENMPSYVPMGRDERVVDDRYNEQDPLLVAADLVAAADALAETFAGLRPAEWQRCGIYNYPERAVRSLAWMGRHTVHEVMHHLTDARTSAGS